MRRRLLPFDLRVQHDDMGNAPHLLSPADAAKIEAGEWHRAGGACHCICGAEYNDHPSTLGALWLTTLCDDTLVKL